METKSRDDSTPLNEGEKGHPGASDLERQLPVESYHRHLLEWIDGNEVRSLLHHPNETGLGERLHQSCMALFEYLWASFSSAPPPLRLGIKSSLHQDLSRLYLWGTSFQSGWLDMILMESDELRDEVLQLLCDIGLVLTKKMSPLASRGPEFPSELQEKVETLSDLILEAQSVIHCHSDKQEDSDSSDFGLRAPDRQGEDYFSSQELTTYTECLMELCETMVRDGVRIMSTRIEYSGLVIEPFRVSEPADFFVRHVGDKFPKADVNLVQRMGQANWERRERIREQMDVASRTDQVYVNEDPAIAQSVFKPTSLFHDSGLGSSIPASIASHRSFASSLASNAKGSLRVPDAPAEVALGKPFKCDFCGHRLLNTRTRVDWKRHVFADLHPYICTEPSCNDLKTFPTRKLWADHEFERHKVERFWQCQKCNSEFSNLEEFQSHRRNEHIRITRLLVRASQVTRPIPINDVKCPLCLEFPGGTRKAYENHVGAHLEDVALACLPKAAESDDEENSASSNSASSKELSETKAKLSKENIPRRSPRKKKEEDLETRQTNSVGLKGFTAGCSPSASAILQQRKKAKNVKAEGTIGAPEGTSEEATSKFLSLFQPAASTPPHGPPRFEQKKTPTPRKELTSSPASIADTQLGLTSGEIQILRQHQQMALYGHSGRATATSSKGKLLLDPEGLQQLRNYFDRLMGTIQQRIESLTEQAELSSQVQYDRAGNITAGVDAEIARLHGVLQNVDELEEEFDKVRRIRDTVRQLQSRLIGRNRTVNSTTDQHSQ